MKVRRMSLGEFDGGLQYSPDGYLVFYDDYADLEAEAQRLREALKSIAANTCCDKCQEAALVAKEALEGGED